MSGQQLTVQGPNSSRTLHLSADSSTDAAAPIFLEEWLGSELWPAAPALVRVLERPEWRARLQSSASPVVELGAGTGAVGLAASVLGAGAVLVTDLPSVLPTLRQLRWAGISTARQRCTGTTTPSGKEVKLIYSCGRMALNAVT